MLPLPVVTLHLPKRRCYSLLLFALLCGTTPKAQYRFLTEAPSGEERLRRLWRYCADNRISDQDSAKTSGFLQGAAHVADSLGDKKLKAYVEYFLTGQRILFSKAYERHFPSGVETAVAVLEQAKKRAEKNGFADIAASCDHYAGQLYYLANRYGQAFDHMLKAHEKFQKIGYNKVPNASRYLVNLGLAYYRFEEWTKAQEAFLQAIRHPFFDSREEISAYNTIALIYRHKRHWPHATRFYRQTIGKAQGYLDTAWVGIASGNLGNVFLEQGQNDSALFYHRTNVRINGRADGEPADAAYSALAMASAFVKKDLTDSALSYTDMAQALSVMKDQDDAYRLDFRNRLLTVKIALLKADADYRTALQLTDSLMAVKDSLRRMLDAKILSRSVEKSEAERYAAELKLVTSEKNLNRLRLYIVVAILFFLVVMGGLLFNRFRMRKKREMELAEKEKQILAAEKQRVEEGLRHAEELLTAYLNTIEEKTTLIENLDTELERLKNAGSLNGLEGVAANMESLVSSTILTDEDWQHFRQLFERVHPGYVYRLKDKFPDLSAAELRLLILTKLRLPSRQMAHMLGISIDAIRKSRYRVRKKLNLEPDVDLEEAIVGV